MPNAGFGVVEIVNRAGSGAAVILCEHASNHIPERYNGLGLRAEDIDSHAAWDLGARATALRLAEALDAPLLASRVSRLVYDCNRPPDNPSAIPVRSERIEVPGNVGLTEAQRAERIATVYRPFCEAVTRLIEARQGTGSPTVLITLHSFAPVYFGESRAVEIGILHDADDRLANAMLSAATALPHRRIMRNAPYGPEDGVTHSLKEHGMRHGLMNVMIEVRNDLLSTAEQERVIAREILGVVNAAFAAVGLRRTQHA